MKKLKTILGVMFIAVASIIFMPSNVSAAEYVDRIDISIGELDNESTGKYVLHNKISVSSDKYRYDKGNSSIKQCSSATQCGYTSASWVYDSKLEQGKYTWAIVDIWATLGEGGKSNPAYDFDSANLSSIKVYVNGSERTDAVVYNYNENWHTVTVRVPVTVNAYSGEYHTVKFMNGTNELSSVQVAHDRFIIKPADPTEDGKVFKGWYQESTFANPANFNQVITEDKTFYAKFEDLVTVTYITEVNLNMAELTNQMTGNEAETKLTASSDANYYVDSISLYQCSTAESCAYNAATRVTTENLQAGKYTYIRFFVNAKPGEGHTRDNPLFDFDQENLSDVKIKFNEVERTDAYISDYNDSYNAIIVYVPVEVKSAAATHTVTFVTNIDGDTNPEREVSVNAGEIVEAPTLTRDGYTLEGWYIDDTFSTKFDLSTPITGEIKLYAKWVANKYTVTIMANDDNKVEYNRTLYSNGATLEFEKDTTVMLFAKAKTGWKFYQATSDDVTISENGSIGRYFNMSAKNVTITFDFRQVYNITYDANEGTGAPAGQEKLNGVDLTLSRTEPTRTGYRFLGWSTSPTVSTVAYNSGATYTANEGITLYAVWEAETEKNIVKFHTNESSLTVPDQEVNTGSKATEPTLTRDGYTLDGWYTEDTFNNKFDFNTEINEDLELYAKWLKNYTYRYVNTTEDDLYTNMQVVATRNPAVPSASPTRDGYEFVGWYTDSTRQTAFDPTTDVVSGDKTIYAGWNKLINSANLIFDNSNINDSMTGNEVAGKISVSTDAEYNLQWAIIYQCTTPSCSFSDENKVTTGTLDASKNTIVRIRLGRKNSSSSDVINNKFVTDSEITVNGATYTGIQYIRTTDGSCIDFIFPITVSENTTTSYPTKPTALSQTSYTYDGNNHLPTVNGFDSNTMTISGNTEQKYVGTYTITVSPKEQWSDGTNTAINLSWSIVAEPKSDSTSYLTMSVGSNKTKGMLEAIVGKTGIVANLTDSSKGTYTLDGGFTATNAGVTSLVYTIPAEDVNNDGKPEYSEYTVTITITVVDDSTPSYSYDFLENTGEQNYTSGNLTSYVIKVDADYTTFKSLKVNGELFTKDTDYEVTEGSTIITFTQAGLNKINNLAAGDYNVEIEFDEEIVTAELKLSAGNNEHNANQNDVQDNNQNTNIDNPKTFDGGIINYVLLSILSILGLSGAIIVRKKRTRA